MAPLWATMLCLHPTGFVTEDTAIVWITMTVAGAINVIGVAGE
jgi:hypothetical protein